VKDDIPRDLKNMKIGMNLVSMLVMDILCN
jgi:hypothetical protein